MTKHELTELFGAIARLKNSLCVAVDEGLQRQHDLPLVLFDAMTAISGSAEGCGPGDLAESLAVSLHEADTIIDALVSSGRAFRKPPHDGSRAAPVALTLSGALALKRAERTIEDVLHAELDTTLSPADQGVLQASLRALRLHDAPRAADTVAGPANSSRAGATSALADFASFA